jgi:hypothetical protein
MSPARAIPSLLPLLLLAACTVEVDGAPKPAYLDESEPNDDPAYAPWFGVLSPGTQLAIAGNVQQYGPDEFDGFAFTAHGPCTIELALEAPDPWTDLDLCVHDPVTGETLVCYDGVANPEYGAVSFADAQRDLQVVVYSSHGDGSYVLRVTVHAGYSALAAPPLSAPTAKARAWAARSAPAAVDGAP